METIINKQSGKVLFATDGEFIETETEIGVDEKLTENFLVPHFNQTTREFYEGATPEEIAAHKKTITPLEVPLWAMRSILKNAGLFQPIIEAINGLEEPVKTMALDFLEYGNFVERHSNTVILIQQITQMSDDQVNDLFIEAEKLRL